jgi:diguanylate cyclase (GGDEF)-like protein
LVPGVHFEDFLRAALERGVYDPGDQPVDEFIRERLEEHRNPEGAYERRVGDERWMRISKHRTESGGVVGIWTDITESKRAEETIRDLALNDPLTGLANRNGFHECLTDAIAAARHLDTRVALLFLDLDRFKRVNDETGHPGGDKLLKQAARRFTMLARETDTVARLGGDEFAIIMTGTASADTSSLLAKRIIDSLAQPFSVYGREVTSGTSIGISIYPDDDTEIDGLIRKADMALYQAKYLGRGTFQLYDEEMHSAVRRGRAIETELRTALARNEFVLHYQPQLDITGAKTTGAEALIRWQHPERGLLSPAEFIDVAETSGLIVEIGKWVLGEACAQSSRWSAAGLPALRIAVNISARQFKSDDLVETVRDVLDETGIEPSLLELEITESMVMHDVEQTTERLSQLTELGLEISIDDFGTGYSSLAYLKQFPVQRLKIDQSFVAKLDVESDDAAIVEAIIRLGHSLRLKVTAEGVETGQQLAMLRELGCNDVQGYFFSKPVTAVEFYDWMSARRRSKEDALSDALN